MVNITNDEWQVLINILGAVETGGQQYGQRDYSDYTEAYTNSYAEDSITIGAFQEFHGLAKGLLRDIKNKYPEVFAKYDNAGIAEDLNLSSWSGYSPSKDSAKAQAIIAIISTPEGKKVQDNRFIEQMKQHVAYGEKKGVTDVGALFEVCNIAHLGGYAAVDRILAKTERPYTVDTIYTALCTDTGANQVGMYKNRLSKVYQWLKQYMPVKQPTTQSETTYEITPGITVEDILNIMRGWIGLNQFDGSHMLIVNIYNNHRPLARNYALTNYDSWCAATVSTAFITADAVDLIGGTECGVERFIEDCFKPKGIWIEDGSIVPESGDIICFNWDQSYQPNNGFADHIGIVEYVEDGMIHTIEGNAGGRVQRRTYPVGDGNIRGFARPKYGTNSSTVKTKESIAVDIQTPSTILLLKGAFNKDVAKMQIMLIALGYDCGGFGPDGDFGNGTEASLKLFQKQHGLKETGIYTIDDKAQLEKSYDNSKAETFPQEMFTIKDPNSYLRTGPSKNKPIIDRLPVSTKVTATKSHINKAGNKWYKVTINDKAGWIVAKSLVV